MLATILQQIPRTSHLTQFSQSFFCLISSFIPLGLENTLGIILTFIDLLKVGSWSHMWSVLCNEKNIIMLLLSGVLYKYV